MRLLVLGAAGAGLTLLLVVRGERSTAAREGEAAFLELYQDATSDQLSDVLQSLHAALEEDTKEYFRSAFASGKFEITHLEKNEEGGFEMPAEELLTNRILHPDGELWTAHLPLEGFESAYRLRDEIAWLSHRQTQVEGLEAAERGFTR